MFGVRRRMKLRKTRYPLLRSVRGGGFDVAGNRRYSGQEVVDYVAACLKHTAAPQMTRPVFAAAVRDRLDALEAILATITSREQIFESGDDRSITELRVLEQAFPFPLGLMHIRSFIEARTRELLQKPAKRDGGRQGQRIATEKKRAAHTSLWLTIDKILADDPELVGQPVERLITKIRAPGRTFRKSNGAPYTLSWVEKLLKRRFGASPVERLSSTERETLRRSERTRRRERDAEALSARAYDEAMDNDDE
jgi:hypothetical protein